MYAQGNRFVRHQPNQVVWTNQTPHDFYRVIVENNIFRPLGWKMPSQAPEYVLIATLVRSDRKTAKALLKEQKSKQIYYVAIGERVRNAIVKDIKSKQVILSTPGGTLMLKLRSNHLLNVSSRSLVELHEQSANDSSPQRPPRRRIHPNPRHQDDNRRHWRSWLQQMRDDFRNATLEDRRRFIEEFRQR